MFLSMPEMRFSTSFARDMRSIFVLPQVGQLPRVHQVCVADDGALGRLAEDLGEADGGHRPAADQIGEQISRPHGGELIRVPHQHQPAVPTQGSHQGGHQGHIHHGDLVHNDRIRLQRVVLVVGEHQLAGVWVKAGLQQAVNGRGQLPPRDRGRQGGYQGRRAPARPSLVPFVFKE